MSVSRFRSVAVLLLCTHLGGCATWQPVNASPRQFIEAESPYKIRFRDPSGAWLHVSYPRVLGDTITGTRRGVRADDGKMGEIPIRMALADVPAIEARLPNRPQSILAVGAVTSVLLGAVMCITQFICTKGSAVSY